MPSTTRRMFQAEAREKRDDLADVVCRRARHDRSRADVVESGVERVDALFVEGGTCDDDLAVDRALQRIPVRGTGRHTVEFYAGLSHTRAPPGLIRNEDGRTWRCNARVIHVTEACGRFGGFILTTMTLSGWRVPA